MSSSTGTVQVVGGGIAGLTAAAALAQQGWSVRVHERDDQLRAFGSGIYLWSNGLAVLDELGVLEQAVEGAHYGGAFESRDRRNVVISRHPVNEAGQVTVVTILRERLINALVDAARSAGVEFVLNSTATTVDPIGSVGFEDGTQQRTDLVVVADGVKSRLRGQLGLVHRRRSLGQSCARLLIPRGPGMVPDDCVDHYVEFYSGKRFVLYTPINTDEVYIALVCQESVAPADGESISAETWVRAYPHLDTLIRQLPGNLRWDGFEHVELHAWSQDNVAILGDAAHAQPPYLGQGGGCAMMAALGLAHAVSSGSGELAQRLREWEARERPVIEHTQRFAYFMGRMISIPDTPRSFLLGAIGRSASFGRSRLRAATAIPTGPAATTDTE